MNPEMHILYETNALLIGHSYEDDFLVEKESGHQLLYDTFYGDPACGLISPKNDWAIIAGHHITIWKAGAIIKYNKEALRCVHALRLKDPQTVEILVDPWAEHAAIWRLDMLALVFEKICDFEDYKHKAYTDEVIW
jgi:hypothetical protein